MTTTLTATVTGTLSGDHAGPFSGTIIMNFGQAPAAVELDSVKSLYDGGSLALYGGQALPVSPETATTGTKLVAFPLTSPAFGPDTLTGGRSVASATFAATNVLPLASGVAIFARAFKADGTTALSDHDVAAPWQPLAPVVLNQCVVNSGNLYRCSVAGTTAAAAGPAGTGAAFLDGGVTWAFVRAATDQVIIFGSTTVTLGVVTSMTALTLATNTAQPETLTIATPPPTNTGVVVPLSGTYTNGPPAALDYSIDGVSWQPLGNPVIGNLAWSGTGPTFAAASPAQTVLIRDRALNNVKATSGAFVVTFVSTVETLTLVTPPFAQVGIPLPLNGTYTNGPPNFFEYSIDNGGTWSTCSLSATTIGGGNWNTVGPSFVATRPSVNIIVRDRGNATIRTPPSGFFAVISGPPPVETLSIVTPSNVRVGVPLNISGTYANVTPTALDYSIDGRQTWNQLTNPVIGGLSWNGVGPTFSAPVASQAIDIRDRVNTAIGATSGSFSVTVAPVETLSVTTPNSAFANNPIFLQGSYTNGPPLALDYATDGVTFLPLTGVTIGGGLWSGTGPTYPAVTSGAQITVQDHNAISVHTATGLFNVTAAGGAAQMTDTEGHVMTDTETPAPDVMTGP